MAKKNEGIMISGGTMSAGQVAVGQNATATSTHFGSGSNVNMDSNLINTQQSASANEHKLTDLPALLTALKEVLNDIPKEKSDEAEAIVAQATQLVDVATKDKPNRSILQVLSSGLKEAATFLKDSVPDALKIASQITSIVARLHGISP